MSNESKPPESQAAPNVTDAPAAAAPAPATSTRLINTRRIEHIKSFVPVVRSRPSLPAQHAPPPPLNPDVHPSDIRLCVDIRLETRTEVIHERTVKEHKHVFILTKGLERGNVLTTLDQKMGEIGAGARSDLETYMRKLNPKLFLADKQPDTAGGPPTPLIEVTKS